MSVESFVPEEQNRELLIRLDGSGTVRVPGGASELFPGEPSGGSDDAAGPVAARDCVTGVLSNGNVSLFPPGLDEGRRASLIRRIAAAQIVANGTDSGTRVTEPKRWHDDYTTSLIEKAKWPLMNEQGRHGENMAQDGTISQAIVRAVASAGLTGAAQSMLQAVLTAALASTPANHPLSLFTWRQNTDSVLVVNINAFEWDDNKQLLFSTAQVKTVYNSLDTSFLVVLRYTSHKLKLESWFTQLVVNAEA